MGQEDYLVAAAMRVTIDPMAKSENEFVAWLARRQRAADGVELGIGDDMAILRTGDRAILVAADMLMDGVHFDASRHAPELIGRKALAVNLSDCAAMAVRPRWVVASVALPNDWPIGNAQALCCGMESLAAEYGCALVGGDTNSWNHGLVIDVCILAEPWHGVPPARRDGVRPGDRLYVSGRLGGSLFEQGDATPRHLVFTPRVNEARRIAEALGDRLHAMMDLSDGLSVDADRMAKASGCSMTFDAAALMKLASQAAAAAAKADGRSVLDHMLNDGEDFELFFAASAEAADTISTAPLGDLDITCIGEAAQGEGLWLIDGGSKRERIEPQGYQHFKSD